MRESLFSILKPLVNEARTGSLRIKQTKGDQADLRLIAGRIIALKVGNLTGKEAGKALSMWLCFTAQFSEETPALDDDLSGLDTQYYLGLLSKIAQRVDKMQKTLALNGVLRRLPKFDFDGKIEFNPEQVKILLAIDGKMSVQQVAHKCRVPECRALGYSYRFLRTGLVKKITSHSPLDKDAIATFLSSVTAFLAERVGSAAETILTNAFEYLESDPWLIYKSEIPELIAAISKPLDGEEGVVFKKWALDNWGSF